MKAFAIQSAIHSTNLSEFHFIMFHGEPVKDEPFGREKAPSLFDRDIKTLYLRRNGRFVPPISKSGSNIVVSEEVKSRLAHLPNISFFPVRFERVVDFPTCRAGDFSFEQSAEFDRLGRYDEIDSFLRNLPDVPAMRSNLGNYYELIVPKLSDLLPKFRSLRNVRCKLLRTAFRDIKFQLSSELLSQYPIVWKIHTIFSESAFSLVSSFLDPEYFDIECFEI